MTKTPKRRSLALAVDLTVRKIHREYDACSTAFRYSAGSFRVHSPEAGRRSDCMGHVPNQTVEPAQSAHPLPRLRVFVGVKIAPTIACKLAQFAAVLKR